MPVLPERVETRRILPATIKTAGSLNSEGYVNVADQLGISTERGKLQETPGDVMYLRLLRGA